MEIFIEEMVNKRKTSSDVFKTIGIVVLALLLIFLVVFVIVPMLPIIGSIMFLLIGGIIYGAYYFIVSSNIEFEYFLGNAEIDVDKITNKTKRKRLTTAPIRNAEAFGTRKNPEFNKYINNSVVNKIYACRDKSEDDIFFIVYNQGDKKIMLVFNPSERIIEQIKKRNPQKQCI